MPRSLSPAQMHQLLRRLQTRASSLRSAMVPVKKSPDEQLGELFQDVQMKRIYPDGMTFVDLVPVDRLQRILKAYQLQRAQPEFDLSAFVSKYFRDYVREESQQYHTNPAHTLEQHINELWDVLTREAYSNEGSLIALPYPYVVPGGRFGAQWYWDSYFMMLGLAASGRWRLTEGMTKNISYMIRKFGRAPSASRTYYLSRSQPPVFALMVELLARKQGHRRTYVHYLPSLVAEHRFWMKGSKALNATQMTSLRTVRMPEGEILNRYFDDRRTPRPEMYKDDVDTAMAAPDRLPSQVYVDIRAAAESGWDFSSRWFRDFENLSTIQTTDIVPVDLNALLVILERTIAEGYRILKQDRLCTRFRNLAERRAKAIEKYCWNEDEQFYVDYNHVHNQQMPNMTLAGVFPLFAQIAPNDRAEKVAMVLSNKFLKPGGLVTSLLTTGQQWDAPNGWAPLQWCAVQALRHYGHTALADEIKSRWLATTDAVYTLTGKLVEKYNVMDPTMSAGGGEYPLQDGFGWSNGVAMAFLKEAHHA